MDKKIVKRNILKSLVVIAGVLSGLEVCIKVIDKGFKKIEKSK